MFLPILLWQFFVSKYDGIALHSRKMVAPPAVPLEAVGGYELVEMSVHEFGRECLFRTFALAGNSHYQVTPCFHTVSFGLQGCSMEIYPGLAGCASFVGGSASYSKTGELGLGSKPDPDDFLTTS